MLTPWTALTLESARRLAVRRIEQGYSQCEVADFLDVSLRTVQRWWHGWRLFGEAALPMRAGRGRKPKLSPAQTRAVLAWLDDLPSSFGFATERWTAPRVAHLIRQRFGVSMNHRYLNDWLRRHGDITPQLPQTRASERDEQRIASWQQHQWPRIKKRRGN